MRPPRKWTYAGAKRARQKRVVKTSEAPRGVWREEPAPPRFNYRPTPKQARIALALAAFTMFAAMSWWAVHSPWLTVSHVTVTGANRLSPEEVRQAAGVDGKSIFTVDLQAARARVAALPNVRSATIAKRGRTGVSIDVEERTTWGSWQMGDAKIPIDIDGYVMTDPAFYGTPTIIEVDPHRVLSAGDRVDPGAVELAARLTREAQTSFGRNVVSLAYRRDAGLTAVLSGASVDDPPLWVTFGDSRDYEYKVAALYVLIEEARQRELALSSVDLRFGDRLSFN